jgi:hypothetical protein
VWAKTAVKYRCGNFMNIPLQSRLSLGILTFLGF